MDALFERRALTKKVHIYSKFLQKNMTPTILHQLRTNLEGKCSAEGFILPDSITILSYSAGRINYVKGGIDYDVQFQVDVCMPHVGQRFKTIAMIRSKAGIHGETSPLKILIPRDLHFEHVDFDQIKIKDEFVFEVIGSRFKQQDTTIIVVGKLISISKEVQLAPTELNLGAEQEEVLQPQSQEGEKIITVQPSVDTSKPKRKLKLTQPSLKQENE